MNLLLDTNILIHLAKSPIHHHLAQIISAENQKIFVSITSIAELKSIALQNNWGAKKWQVINTLLNETVIIEINESLADTYAEIDSFSQCRNPSYASYSFVMPRNMGKNDLWIASTAALLGLKLITSDTDFNHLHQVFIEIQYIKPELLAK